MCTMVPRALACTSFGPFPPCPMHMPSRPQIAPNGVLNPLPCHRWWCEKVNTEDKVGIFFVDGNTTILGDFLVTLVQIHTICFYFAQMLIRLYLDMRILKIDLQMLKAL